MPSRSRKTMSIGILTAAEVIAAHTATIRDVIKMVFFRPSQSPAQPWMMEPHAAPNANNPLTAPRILLVYELVATWNQHMTIFGAICLLTVQFEVLVKSRLTN